ncbi:MAG TPA: NADPH-dependent F420 reductase [Blastocatellia bacterium]|nr:NADPH-dependent F420 reductase [Blastocatellia bacterium]
MSNQRIAIIGGTGDQGKGLALRWARAGFEIIIGSRDRERARAASAEMRAVLAASGSGGADGVKLDGEANADAAARASIIVLTIPFAAHISTLREIREKIRPGALIVDVTVPLEPAVGGKPTRVLGVWAGSAAEQCQELAPEGAKVVSAFQNAGAEALSRLDSDVECDIIVCGDDKDSKQRLRPLVEAIPGCRYIDGGPLANSRTVEAMTALLIGFNIRYKTHTGLRITGIE